MNKFTSAEELAAHIKQAGFVEHQLMNQLYVSKYGSVLDLMLELKRLGAQTVIKSQNRSLMGQNRLNSMMAAYQRSEAGFITATFEVITVLVNLK